MKLEGLKIHHYSNNEYAILSGCSFMNGVFFRATHKSSKNYYLNDTDQCGFRLTFK